MEIVSEGIAYLYDNTRADRIVTKNSNQDPSFALVGLLRGNHIRLPESA